MAQDSLVSVNKIWDNGTHSAFPSIEKYNGKYYISFREGESHIFDQYGKAEGKIRILTSDDGNTWESVILLSEQNIDLRDPKLSVTPDGRLMVLMAGSVYKADWLQTRQQLVSFSSDGTHFTEPKQIRMVKKGWNSKDWLWRITWAGETGYVVNYYMANDGKTKINLHKTNDGENYDWMAELNVPGRPNEATVRILPNQQMLMMVRREEGDQKGYWGISNPPYTDWEWTPMEMRLGGPDFIMINDSICVAGTRDYSPPSPTTVLLTGTIDGKFQKKFVLPSGGDTSYPGFLIVGDELWVCYYSSHETSLASIYLAKIPMRVFKKFEYGDFPYLNRSR